MSQTNLRYGMILILYSVDRERSSKGKMVSPIENIKCGKSPEPSSTLVTTEYIENLNKTIVIKQSHNKQYKQ